MTGLVRVVDAALFAGVSEATVRSWVARGKLAPVRRRGRVVWLRLEDVVEVERATRREPRGRRRVACV